VELLVGAAAMVAAVALAWGWLISSMTSGDMASHGMEMAAPDVWSANYLVSAFVMWASMMVAMMLPSAAPMILLHARIDRAPTPSLRMVHIGSFVLSYVLVWTLFSILAALGQALMVDVGLISPSGLKLSGRVAAGGLLIAAAAYQLTSIKGACLDQCRSPIQFVMRHWKPGVRGALRLGVAHGLFCLGCCWGLMLLLFVGGVMNLAWIAGLALIVFAEKMLPRAWKANLAIAAVLAAAGLWLLLGG